MDILHLFFHCTVPFPLERAFFGDVVPADLHGSTTVLLCAGCEQPSGLAVGALYGPVSVLSQVVVSTGCASSAFFASVSGITPRQSLRSQGFDWRNKCLVDKVPRVF